jgi:hypothetical protein
MARKLNHLDMSFKDDQLGWSGALSKGFNNYGSPIFKNTPALDFRDGIRSDIRYCDAIYFRSANMF